MAGSQGGQLDGGVLLNKIFTRDPELGQLLQDMIDGVNRVATNTGTSATGDVRAPKAPDSVNVTTAGEMMHVSINHSGPIQRGIRYFTEVATTPTFGQPIVIDHGSSRTRTPFSLPTKDSDGNTINYYVRSYAQNPGGPPSEPYVVGGKNNPTAFTMSGSTKMSLLPSTGSGTAPNNGQSAGQGLGKFQRRSN